MTSRISATSRHPGQSVYSTTYDCGIQLLSDVYLGAVSGCCIEETRWHEFVQLYKTLGKESGGQNILGDFRWLGGIHDSRSTTKRKSVLSRLASVNLIVSSAFYIDTIYLKKKTNKKI